MGFERFLRLEFFLEEIQRRGTHVNTPKIGSRVGLFLHRGNIGFYAELRREFYWGNLNLGIFGGFGSGPRRTTEEGGQLVFLFVLLGELMLVL
jgi:hypothetical protein